MIYWKLIINSGCPRFILNKEDSFDILFERPSFKLSYNQNIICNRNVNKNKTTIFV